MMVTVLSELMRTKALATVSVATDSEVPAASLEAAEGSVMARVKPAPIDRLVFKKPRREISVGSEVAGKADDLEKDLREDLGKVIAYTSTALIRREASFMPSRIRL
jgi:hypothetical protein